MPVAREIRYFEVDERETSPNKFYNDKERLNILSDTKSSSETSRFNETWNIRGDDDSRVHNLLFKFTIIEFINSLIRL